MLRDEHSIIPTLFEESSRHVLFTDPCQTHHGLGGAGLGGTDWVFRDSVLSKHPNLTSADVGLGTFKAQNIFKLLFCFLYVFLRFSFLTFIWGQRSYPCQKQSMFFFVSVSTPPASILSSVFPSLSFYRSVLFPWKLLIFPVRHGEFVGESCVSCKLWCNRVFGFQGCRLWSDSGSLPTLRRTKVGMLSVVSVPDWLQFLCQRNRSGGD